jgi:hypothetical protein
MIYDALAFKSSDYPEAYTSVERHGTGKKTFWKDYLPWVQAQKWHTGEPWYPVFSCYGALAIYRRTSIKISGCGYVVPREDEVSIVNLNDCLRRRLGENRNYLNPNMITRYWDPTWQDGLSTQLEALQKTLLTKTSS